MRQQWSSTAGSDMSVQLAEYVCGLLKPEEHAQVHMLLGRDDGALAEALAWEERMLALVDALPRVQPSPSVRERLQRTLGIGPPPAMQPPPQPQLLRRQSVSPAVLPPAAPPSQPSPAEAKPQPGPAPHAATEAGTTTGSPAEAVVPQSTGPDRSHDPARHRRLLRKLWLWRLISLCAVSAAIVGFMLPGEPPPPPIQVVKVAPTRAAILQAPGSSSTPGWTATLDPHGNLMMRPLVQTEVPMGSQVLLWTRSGAIPESRLLGRIDPNRPVQVPSAQLGALAEDQLLEITLETDEDASSGTPQGPILFIGQMTVFGSEGSVATGSGGEENAGKNAAGGSVTGAPGR